MDYFVDNSLCHLQKLKVTNQKCEIYPKKPQHPHKDVSGVFMYVFSFTSLLLYNCKLIIENQHLSLIRSGIEG